MTKDDHFYIDPYVNYDELCSNPQIEFEEFIEQLQSVELEFGSLEGEINALFNDASETFKVIVFEE